MQKVYELRIYKCKPKYFADFIKITNEKIALRTAASKLVGYWSTDIGGINEVVHIWEYDDLKHRAQVRAALGTNQQWQSEYISQIKHMWDSQENNLLSVQGTIASQSQKTKGTYLLQKFSPGKIPTTSVNANNHQPTLIGDFDCVLGGDQQHTYKLWRHDDIDALVHWQMSQASQLEKDGLLEKLQIQSKLMAPTMFSPLQ